jgi:hypothetical protein
MDTTAACRLSSLPPGLGRGEVVSSPGCGVGGWSGTWRARGAFLPLTPGRSADGILGGLSAAILPRWRRASAGSTLSRTGPMPKAAGRRRGFFSVRCWRPLHLVAGPVRRCGNRGGGWGIAERSAAGQRFPSPCGNGGRSRGGAGGRSEAEREAPSAVSIGGGTVHRPQDLGWSGLSGLGIVTLSRRGGAQDEHGDLYSRNPGSVFSSLFSSSGDLLPSKIKHLRYSAPPNLALPHRELWKLG